MQKFLAVMKVIIAAISKFLKFSYAPEITIAALAMIIFLGMSQLVGVIFIAWDILLLINEIKQNKIAKQAAQPKV